MKNTRICCKLLILLLCFAMLLPLTGCGESKMSQSMLFAMDTEMTLTAYGNKGEAGLSAAESVIRSMDSALDPELETSTVYAINHAKGENTAVSGQVARMITVAQEIYTRSDGALDLTIYPVIKLWGFIDNKFYVPSEAEIFAEREKLCFDKVILTSFPDQGSYAVSMPENGELSFGAIAKGCAAQNAIDAMRSTGVTSGIISLGGNVQTLGLRPDGSDWQVAIRDPNNTSSYLGVLNIGEAAVVTSGTYQRCFTDAITGKTYHHLIKPSTGYPVTNTLQSLTVIGEDGTTCDALSTALFILGQSKALNYWRTYGGFEMIMVTDENEIICTSGLIEKFVLSNSNYKLTFTE